MRWFFVLMAALISGQANAGPLDTAQSAGLCISVGESIITNHEVDFLLEDDWNADRVFAIIDASQARYEIIVAEATDGKDAATANRLKARLKESFDMGFSFGEGYASGGLNRSAIFLLENCWKNRPGT